jgi:hypothetical protein
MPAIHFLIADLAKRSSNIRPPTVSGNPMVLMRQAFKP